METNRFERFAVFGLLYINLGRPQDVFPMIKFIHPGMIFGVLVLYALYHARRENRLFGDPLYAEKKWFIALWVMMFISTIFSIYLSQSVDFIIEYLKVMLLFFGLLTVLKLERDFYRLAIVLLISVLTLSYPIVADGISSKRIEVGTCYDANDMAMFVSCAIPFLLYLFHQNAFKLRVISLIAITFGVLMVIASQSRMGFLALLINGLFYLIFNLSPHHNSFRKVTIVAGVIIVFAAFAGNFYWDRVKSTFDTGQTGSGRTLVWERGLQVVAEHPVLGAGPGTFISAYGRMLKAGYFEPVGNEYDRAWKAAHNSYLTVAAELGLAGLLFFLMIVRLTLGRVNQIRKLCEGQSNREQVKILANVTTSSLCIFLFCALFLSQAYSALFITLVACSILVRRIYTHTEEASAERVAVNL